MESLPNPFVYFVVKIKVGGHYVNITYKFALKLFNRKKWIGNE